MEKQKSNMLRKTVFAGTIIAGAIMGTATVNSANAFDFNALGSGPEVRSVLMNGDATGTMNMDMKCGADSSKTQDGKCGDKKADKGKHKDSKCGEGKCGDDKKDMKKSKKK